MKTMMILFFLCLVWYHSVERAPLVFESNLGDGRALLRCETRLSPGTTALFTTKGGKMTSLRVERLREGSRLYEARFTQPRMADSVVVGSESTLYTPLRSFPIQDQYGADFWISLQNCYPTPEEPSILSEMMQKGKKAELQVGQYIRLMFSSYKEQHISLLEIEPGGKTVKVWYPNSECLPPVLAPIGAVPLTFRAVWRTSSSGGNHLEEEAFICSGIGADKRGKSVFVALLSDQPRALADWLPNSQSSASYVDLNGKPIHSWQVGPGFYDLNAARPSFDRNADHLQGGTWSLATCHIGVK